MSAIELLLSIKEKTLTRLKVDERVMVEDEAYSIVRRYGGLAMLEVMSVKMIDDVLEVNTMREKEREVIA